MSDPLNAVRQLHRLYASESEMVDASRLAYLLGPDVEWSEHEVAELWKEAAAASASGRKTHNHMYVHVPFCKSICSFCNYERLRPSRPELLQEYLERCLQSIERIAPSTRTLRFRSLYFGGGTPSTLPAKLLDQLLHKLGSHFQWHKHVSRQFEFDPAILNRRKLEVLHSHGFNRFSFGLQTLDAAVNQAHNRGPQGLRIIEQRFKEFAELNIEDVACDVLLGLQGTTPEQMLAEITTIVSEFRPAVLDIFMVTPTHDYVRRHFAGEFSQFWEHLRQFETYIPPRLPELAERYGYELRQGQGHHMCLSRPILREAKFAYAQQIQGPGHPINLLGIGPSARSAIFGVGSFQARQHERGFRYRGHRLKISDEMRIFLVHALRDTNSISKKVLLGIFGSTLESSHPVAHTGWLTESLLSEDSENYYFKEQQRQKRIESLLWLVEPPNLEHEIYRRWGWDLRAEKMRLLCSPLQEGQVLKGSVRWSKSSYARLWLHDTAGDHRLSLRLKPVADDAPPKIVLEQPINTDAQKTSVRLVQMVLRKNWSRNMSLIKKQR